MHTVYVHNIFIYSFLQFFLFSPPDQLGISTFLTDAWDRKKNILVKKNSFGNFNLLFSLGIWVGIYKTSFFLKLTNGLNKLECLLLASLSGLINWTLAYRVHSQVKKNEKASLGQYSQNFISFVPYHLSQ